MKYKISKKLEGVVIIQPDIFYDYRGEYVETWNVENYKIFDHIVNNSKKIEFKQDDISTSVKHTLRGLHGDNKTWKLVSCVYGSLLQVVVDMRESSDTYLEYDMFSINDKNRNQILIPPGCVNGHLCLSNECIFHYKLTEEYVAAQAHGATHNGQLLGTFGDVSNFTFFFAHHMTTIEGGMVSTNNEELYEHCRIFRSHGMLRECTNKEFLCSC